MFSEKNILLDLDNTLYNYQNAHRPAMMATEKFLSNQYRLPVSRIRENFELSRDAVKQRLGNTASSHNRLLYLSNMTVGLGFAAQIDLISSAESLYWNTFLDNMHIEKGAMEFLTTARHSGFRIILVTDLTVSIQYRKIKFLGLESLLDIVVTSEDCGGDKVTGKPEKMLRDLFGEMSGVCVGDGENDHLFSDSTIFYMKGRSTVIKRRVASNFFTNFSQLTQKINQRKLFSLKHY
jgi:FMN phosphatase YigB (HAD superfamily)